MSIFEKSPPIPRDASAMVLLRDPADPKVFWIERAPTLSFMAGYHAFPGGQRDPEDDHIPILNAAGHDDVVMRIVAIREIFEETGVLIARGAEALTPECRLQLRSDLLAGRIEFKRLLAEEGLELDAAMLSEAPRWVTPSAYPRRFDTRFYSAWLPDGQETEILPGEIASGEWIRPVDALRRWIDGDCVIVTPITSTLQALVDGAHDFVPRMHSTSQESRDHLEDRVEMRYGIHVCALRTPTIPPATHTNCLIIGGDDLIVIDPGSPYPDEQAKLDRVIDHLLSEGRRIREIVITHLHPDHIGGVMHLAERYDLPVATHRLTASEIGEEIRVDRHIEDGELIELREGATGIYWRLRAMWTPGHARGHLSFYEERTGTLMTGDCVVGFGTVVIAPPEGNMTHYLASLQRYLELPRLTALMPGHGPVVATSRRKIEEYIDHRLAREASIVAALESGSTTPREVVEKVYTDVALEMHQLAELSVQAHLDKLESEGRVFREGTGHYRVGP